MAGQSRPNLHTPALDEPVWGSLTGAHAGLALRVRRAARYPAQVGPLAALAAPDPDALDDLAELVPAGDVVALFEGDGIPDDPRFQRVARVELIQMVCETPVAGPALEPFPLSIADVPAMLALAELTQPGPFGPRTIELGHWVGFRDERGLAAMGGERLHPPGYAEVSGVCSAPHARGKGLAESVVRALASRMQAQGEIPFLHVAHGSPSEANAIALYVRLGFRERRRGALAVLLRRADPEAA